MKKIEVITIPVSDQEKAMEFYKKLGFKVAIEAPMGNGQKWIQMKLPRQGTHITLVSWFPYKEIAMKPGSLQGINFETDDIVKEVKRLKKKGIDVWTMDDTDIHRGNIDTTPWGKWTHFTDPDGNGLNLHQK